MCFSNEMFDRISARMSRFTVIIHSLSMRNRIAYPSLKNCGRISLKQMDLIEKLKLDFPYQNLNLDQWIDRASLNYFISVSYRQTFHRSSIIRMANLPIGQISSVDKASTNENWRAHVFLVWTSVDPSDYTVDTGQLGVYI